MELSVTLTLWACTAHVWSQSLCVTLDYAACLPAGSGLCFASIPLGFLLSQLQQVIWCLMPLNHWNVQHSCCQQFNCWAQTAFSCSLHCIYSSEIHELVKQFVFFCMMAFMVSFVQLLAIGCWFLAEVMKGSWHHHRSIALKRNNTVHPAVKDILLMKVSRSLTFIHH
jgi:hypothetical protein